MPQGLYVNAGFTADQLRALIASAQTELQAIMARGQSYGIAGRSRSSASISELNTTISEAGYALGLITGTTSTRSIANFNRSINRGNPPNSGIGYY